MNINDYWNGWRVAELLGEGTFGTVYRIEKTEYGHTYNSALKVVRVPKSQAEVRTIQSEGMDEESMTMYFNSMVENIVSELALMSKLRGNSNIVSYEDHKVVKLEDTFGWDVFIKMELLTPLYDYINNNEITLKEIVRLGIDICKALELCSKYNIIHRDIKPENIFHSEHGDFKLGDFGIARELEKTMAGLSRTGTPAYMAPEVYKGLPYNSTVDTYSLGIVLYRLLNNNRTPFLPDYPKKITFNDRQNANIKRLSGEIPPIPCNADRRLGKIILKACAYDPKERYHSAEEMRIALEDYYHSKKDNRVLLPLRDEIGKTDKKTNNREEDEATAETVTLEEVDTNGPEEKAEMPLAVGDEDVIKQGYFKKPRTRIAAALVVLCLALVPLGYRFFHHTVPDLVDLHSDAAMLAVEHAGLKYNEADRVFSDTVPRGVIISQSKEGGTQVKRGTVINVVVSRGVPIKLPNVTGKKEATAARLLSERNLVLNVEKKEYSETVKKGRVISQDPEPGTECEETQVINVVLSKGIELVKVPNVVDLTQEEAEKALNKAGLNSEIELVFSSAAAGSVVEQSELAGDKIAKNSTVIISVSTGMSTNNSTSSRSTYKKGSSSKTNTSKEETEEEKKKKEEEELQKQQEEEELKKRQEEELQKQQQETIVIENPPENN